MTGASLRRRVARLPRYALMGAIKGYQLVISPLEPASCKYFPTCSTYAMTAVERFGLLRGGGLALWRLARCNPFSRGGVDHVPATWSERGAGHGQQSEASGVGAGTAALR